MDINNCIHINKCSVGYAFHIFSCDKNKPGIPEVVVKTYIAPTMTECMDMIIVNGEN